MSQVVVFGSITVDMITRVSRLPGPGETVLCPSYDLAPGGKGANQAVAAARAGADTVFIGSVGNDEFVNQAVENLHAEKVDISRLQHHETARTAVAAVMVDDHGENQIVVAAGANLTTRLTQLTEAECRRGDILLLQLEIDLEEIWAAVEHGKQLGMRTVLNAAPFAPIPEEVLRSLDILIVNEVEAAMLADHIGRDATDLKQLAADLAGACELTVIITLGKDGAIAHDGEQGLSVPALRITALDTVGAGDGFVGAFCAALAQGEELAAAMTWGSIAGSLACTGQGAQSALPTGEAIRARLKDISPPSD